MNLITLSEENCQTRSAKKLFGLCDDPHPAKNPAYIDEGDGAKWIAVVVNDHSFDVVFTAVDHCIETKRVDGNLDHRCDGVLHYNTTVIFVELKERGARGNDWVVSAEKQLRASIRYFEKQINSDGFQMKKAYIANKEHPKFKDAQSFRMKKFQDETGYTLRIENRIELT
jgi:hypothetical protein